MPNPGDVNTPFQYYGDDHRSVATNVIRSLTDGEKNTGYTDLDGIWSDGEPAYIINVENFNMNTGTIKIFI